MLKSIIISLVMFPAFNVSALSMSESTTIGNAQMSYNGVTKGIEHKSTVSDSFNVAGNKSVSAHDETTNRIKSKGSLYGSSDTNFTTVKTNSGSGLTVSRTNYLGTTENGSNIRYKDKYTTRGYSDSEFSGNSGIETEHAEYDSHGKTVTNVSSNTNSTVSGWATTWGE